MRFRYKMMILGFLYCLPLISSATESTPITAIILDSPIDFENEVLTPYLNMSALKDARFVHSTGEAKSWFDINIEKKEKFEKLLNAHQFDEQIQFLNSMSKVESEKATSEEKAQFKWIARKEMLKLLFSSKYQQDLGLLSTYLMALTSLA